MTELLDHYEGPAVIRWPNGYTLQCHVAYTVQRRIVQTDEGVRVPGQRFWEGEILRGADQLQERIAVGAPLAKACELERPDGGRGEIVIGQVLVDVSALGEGWERAKARVVAFRGTGPAPGMQQAAA